MIELAQDFVLIGLEFPIGEDWECLGAGRFAKSSDIAWFIDASIATMAPIRGPGTRRSRLSHGECRWEPGASGLPRRADFSRPSMFLSNSCS